MSLQDQDHSPRCVIVWSSRWDYANIFSLLLNCGVRHNDCSLYGSYGKITSCRGTRASLAEYKVFEFHLETYGRLIFLCTTGDWHQLTNRQL